jgi:hypothetical protein
MPPTTGGTVCTPFSSYVRVEYTHRDMKQPSIEWMMSLSFSHSEKPFRRRVRVIEVS